MEEYIMDFVVFVDTLQRRHDLGCAIGVNEQVY